MIFLLKIFIYLLIAVFFWGLDAFVSDPFEHRYFKSDEYDPWDIWAWIVHFVFTIIVLAIGYFIFFII